MINKIGDKKQHRAAERGDHAASMSLLIFQSDKTITHQKKNGAERIQRRVHIGELGDGNHRGKMSGINIRVKKTQRTKGESAIRANVLFSNLRCMKCMATNAAFQTAITISKATSRIFGRCM